MAIRPQAVRLRRVEEADGAGMAVEVLKATYLGDHIEYTVSASLGELCVIDHQVGKAFRPGTAARLELARRGVTLVRP